MDSNSAVEGEIFSNEKQKDADSGSKKKFRSIKRKKRRGFHGKKNWEMRRERAASGEDRTVDVARPRPSGSTSTNLTPTRSQEKLTTSARKLKHSPFQIIAGASDHRQGQRKKRVASSMISSVPANGFKIQDANELSKGLERAAVCSVCRKGKLVLLQNDKNRTGLAEELSLNCSSCKQETVIPTSVKISGGAFEVNRRSVLAAQAWGQAGLSNFCALMDLPPPVSKKPYNDHMKQIENQATKNAEKVMTEAADRLRQFLAKEFPEKLHKNEQGQLIGDVSVTVDGTWQKRGHSSKIGVVFVISVDTGEVLDYEIKSLVCFQCRSKDSWDKNSEKYQKWLQTHKVNCMINHEGSSESMETEGAIAIFKRSVETRGLQYVEFVGDGDSSCFGNVKEAMADIYQVNKEECVGHIQKRMETALRKLVGDYKGKKLADGKGVGGKGRLTKVKVDRMQNYYGMAIRKNSGNLKGMQNDIWAIYHHMIKANSAPLNEQHKYCPKDSDSWCKYWRDSVSGSKTYDDDTRLPIVFQPLLKGLFTRLTEKTLLKRCLKGLTQNQNESVNGILWKRCPKTLFCGKIRVRIVVAETVANFNTGAGNEAVLLQSLGVSSGTNTINALELKDRKRIYDAAKKTSAKYKIRRQTLRALKKAKADKKSYSSGSFGLSKKRDVPKKVKPARKKTAERIKKADKTGKVSTESATTKESTQRASKRNMVEITFVLPEQETEENPLKRTKR